MENREHLEFIREFLESSEHWHSLENCEPSLDSYFCDYFNYDLGMAFSFGQAWQNGIAYLYTGDMPSIGKFAEFPIIESRDIVMFLKNEQNRAALRG